MQTRAEPQRQDRLLLALTGLAMTPYLVNGYINSLVKDSLLLYWLFDCFCWILVPSLLAFVAVRKLSLRPADIGLHEQLFGRRNVPGLMIAAVILCPVDYLLYEAAIHCFASIFPDQPFFTYKEVIPEAFLPRIMVVLYFSLTAGLVEEVLFRGALYRAISAMKHARLLFLIISPLLFSVVHWEGGYANLCATFVFGLAAALLYLWLKNLWPLVVSHVFTDIISFY